MNKSPRNAHLEMYLDYIANAGGQPTIEQFDEDWEPIGEMVRADLKKRDLAEEENGRIILKGLI